MNAKIYYFSLFTILLMVGTGCSWVGPGAYGYASISGLILESGTEVPLADVSVVATRSDIFDKIYPDEYYGKTDTNGEYTIFVKTGEWYLLAFSKTTYQNKSYTDSIYVSEDKEEPITYMSH